MFIIDKNNKIRLTKGDTATMYVEVFDLLKNKYEIKNTDSVVLTVKKNVSSTTAALSKTMTADHYFYIAAADTANMATGLYVYDVQLTSSNGYVYTIIPTSYFELTAEVS